MTSVRTYQLNLTVACALILLSAVAFARLSPGRLGARLDRVPEVETPSRPSSTRDIVAMLVAIACVLVIRIAGVYTSALTQRSPSGAWLSYALPLLGTALALVYCFAPGFLARPVALLQGLARRERPQ